LQKRKIILFLEVIFAQKKDSFSSRLGFIISTAGSAIGLANIWKFPYLVGIFGGGFIILYILFLVAVGIPVLFSEIVIGKTTQKEPQGAFQSLGRTHSWGVLGLLTVITGFLVSSFYSVVAGWIVGYIFESLFGHLSPLSTLGAAEAHYMRLMASPLWTIFYHAVFMWIACWFLLGGIKKGIEFCNKLFMPLFFLILIALSIFSARLPTAGEVFTYLLHPSFSSITGAGVIIALGHAFFTLSVGQGTMVTYGSYLRHDEKIVGSTLIVVAADTLVALLSSFCVLSIVFFAKEPIEFGPGLIFATLPSIFADLPFGQVVGLLFFILVFIAALTSQVSALEPLIAHLMTKNVTRRSAVLIVCGSSFLLGVPSALSCNVWKHFTLFGQTILDLMNFSTTSILIPLGGLIAVLLVGWRWGIEHALDRLHIFSPFWRRYFTFTISYVAPLLMIIVFIHALGVI
jgi:neurotransmitter:Na+ symporter, NSS family